MNLSNELTNDGLKKYNKIVNLPYRDRALEVFDVVKTFEKSNLAFDRMVSLAEYEHKDNVLITMLPQAIHLGISTQYIYICLARISNEFRRRKNLPIRLLQNII